MEVLKYSAANEKEWDDFVNKAKNGHFIFLRRYMEYHAHRFQDESLLFYLKNKLIAVLPAHIDGDILASHRGLTFGGVLYDSSMTFSLMRNVFSALKEYLSQRRICNILYKAIPVCYHKNPASEDVAALTLMGAIMTARDLISVIDLAGPPVDYFRGVRWSIKKACSKGLQVRRSTKWAVFMDIMTQLLQSKYGLQPAHSADEMIELAHAFPENILLYGIYKEELLLGGAILYISEQVVHAQYIGMSSEGKKLRALPFLLDTIFNRYRGEKQYFSFGSSQDKEYINESLYHFKESMGARAMLQEQYLLSF